jgi:hypothetical protein
MWILWKMWRRTNICSFKHNSTSVTAICFNFPLCHHFTLHSFSSPCFNRKLNFCFCFVDSEMKRKPFNYQHFIASPQNSKSSTKHVSYLFLLFIRHHQKIEFSIEQPRDTQLSFIALQFRSMSEFFRKKIFFYLWIELNIKFGVWNFFSNLLSFKIKTPN